MGTRVLGYWDDQRTVPRHPMEEQLAAAARTGDPMPFVVEVDGSQWVGVVTVARNATGEYACTPVKPFRRRWVPVVRLDPRRLPE